MKSIFLEGLESAREIVQNKGITALDDLINELKSTETENARVNIQVETR
jgi:hypothetical protein